MELRDESRGGLLIIEVRSPRIDASRAPRFKEEIARRIEGGHARLVLDFSMVDFVDSIGLGALVSCLKRVGRNGSLCIVGVKGAVSRLFSLTRMDRVFALYPSLDDALASEAAKG